IRFAGGATGQRRRGGHEHAGASVPSTMRLERLENNPGLGSTIAATHGKDKFGVAIMADPCKAPITPSRLCSRKSCTMLAGKVTAFMGCRCFDQGMSIPWWVIEQRRHYRAVSCYPCSFFPIDRQVIVSALLEYRLAVPIANDLQALCETLQLMGNSTVPSLQSWVSEVLKPSKRPYEYDDGSDPPSRQCMDVGIGQYGMHLPFYTITLDITL
ncbi:hypothetical protein BKA70DRAFT_1308306, partial [Coprinopsis sp. MPI-PUGE-AT-0042]